MSNPASAANCSAPLATSRTCRVFSMTARAAEIGFLDHSDVGHRAGLHCLAVHDRGVEFVLAFVGEDRALAGVEQGVVFHHANGRFHGIEARSVPLQLLIAGPGRCLQGRGDSLFKLRCHLLAIFLVGRAAMNDDYDLLRLAKGIDRGSRNNKAQCKDESNCTHDHSSSFGRWSSGLSRPLQACAA